MKPSPWLRVRRPLSPQRAALLTVLSFMIPVALWCALSYAPGLWQPEVLIAASGDSEMLHPDSQVSRQFFRDENTRLIAAGKKPASGTPTNPVYLPPPHAVAQALVTAFTTPPRLASVPWFHASVLDSLQVIAVAFTLAVIIAVPIGIACGVWDAAAKLVEPLVDFLRYMPPPAFGTLMVGILGAAKEPKMAVIAIGIVFNLILVIASTARSVDRSLIEAAQTLGADQRRLITRVIVPAMLPGLWRDLRIALGVGWVYLTAAELIGQLSGITQFINLNGIRFRNFANVYAGIIIIGLLGLITDQVLAFIGRRLFPWNGDHGSRAGTAVWRALWWLPLLPWNTWRKRGRSQA